MAIHDHTDSMAGQPLCPDCYDYAGHLMWQWWAPELWRRFTITLRRRLVAHLGLSETAARQRVRVQFAKVAEFQRRGIIHFHALIRLDGPPTYGGYGQLSGNLPFGRPSRTWLRVRMTPTRGGAGGWTCWGSVATSRPSRVATRSPSAGSARPAATTPADITTAPTAPKARCGPRTTRDGGEQESTLVVGSWRFAGMGWLTGGDAALAAASAARARDD
ncbi:MAG: hypothetical protein QOF52_1474 [Propionibacteriaceae bacterium]|jgi:hypothetical protein|nr:replication initiation protein [Propionibacteriaceae bacterium]MDX6321616.1 hypothetical protein [Propionibacteriaceae bacterium]